MRENALSAQSIRRKEMRCPSVLALVLSRTLVYTLGSAEQPGATPVKDSLWRCGVDGDHLSQLSDLQGSYTQ